MKAVVATFNQEKALVGALSVIAQLCRLIVYTTLTQDLFPMLWRFLPVLDPQVELAMSRDLDSRFTAREAAAVAEWRAGECPGSLHAMRDHPWHGVPVMGGGWGAKLDTELRCR